MAYEPIQFNTIEEIRQHRFIGNFHDDYPAFRGIRQFVEDASHPLAERAEAIRIEISEGMGMTPESASDQETVDVYMSVRS